MPTNRQWRRRTRGIELDSAARHVLSSGIDCLGHFDDAGGEARLFELTQRHGDELLVEHIARDRTTRPAFWWWWETPSALRIPYGKSLLPTEQRQLLLRNELLAGEAKVEAEKKVKEWHKSKKPMAFFDLCRKG